MTTPVFVCYKGSPKGVLTNGSIECDDGKSVFSLKEFIRKYDPKTTGGGYQYRLIDFQQGNKKWNYYYDMKNCTQKYDASEKLKAIEDILKKQTVDQKDEEKFDHDAKALSEPQNSVDLNSLLKKVTAILGGIERKTLTTLDADETKDALITLFEITKLTESLKEQLIFKK